MSTCHLLNGRSSLSDPKYQCLVEAAKNSGLESELPPIKEGASVREHNPSRADVPGDLALFIYDAENGKTVSVLAHDDLERGDPKHALFPRTKEFTINDVTSDPVQVRAFAASDGTRFNERTSGKPATPGTVAETTDKLLSCRTPPTF